jgi:hypothetical protein
MRLNFALNDKINYQTFVKFFQAAEERKKYYKCVANLAEFPYREREELLNLIMCG